MITPQKIREHINSLKNQNVPQLIRDKNAYKLNDIIESIDYSLYTDCMYPHINFDSLKLNGEDDYLATALYIFCNPYIEGGDLAFFADYDKFYDGILKYCGSWGSSLVNALLKNYILSQWDYSEFLGMDVYEFVCPEKLSN